MTFDPELAEKRLGYGLSPLVAAPQSTSEMIARLKAPDAMARRFPVPSFADFSGRMIEINGHKKTQRKAKTEAERDKARKARSNLVKRLVRDSNDMAAQTLARRIHSPQGFRERLVAFWADHFTVRGRIKEYQLLLPTYTEDAVRPFIAGSFGDLLIAAVTHPIMLHFLEQKQSVGPNSKRALKAKKPRGLNENLAREVLELHTLGVDGPYAQDDVRQLAELFTGLDFSLSEGFFFRTAAAEPGAETVLGKRYGGRSPRLEDIHDALRDLALHPATARHLAGKLARHFVSDHPDPALVAALEDRYLATGGDLLSVYEELLDHPSVWTPPLENIKPPIDFISSAMRAMAIAPESLEAMKLKDMRRLILHPLRRMGQPWDRAPGPDGWPEEDEIWVSPQGMAGRLQWAMFAPSVLSETQIDPRQFVTDALGANPPAEISFAASAAENRQEGVALVLMSPAFQRR